MTRLRKFSSPSAKTARCSAAALVLAVCTSACSLQPPHVYTRDELVDQLTKISSEKHGVQVVPRLTGGTLWVYVPLTDPILIAAQNPESEPETAPPPLYKTKTVDGQFQGDRMEVRYDIRPYVEDELEPPPVPSRFKFTDTALIKINGVSRSAQDLLFRIHRDRGRPNFLGVVAADMRSGYEVIYINYVDDAKKVFHRLISKIEYRHRTIEASMTLPWAIGDTVGKHWQFRDVAMDQFLLEQIKKRIRTKFSGKELQPRADIDAECVRTVSHVLGTYPFDTCQRVDLMNLIIPKTISMTRKDITDRLRVF